MASPPNPHDAYFRQVFGQPRHMAGLLKIVLPPQINALLDLDPARLRFLDPTHVDPELRGTTSDLIVEVPRREARGSSRGSPPDSAIFVFAVEHQRRDERFIVFRQLTYCVRIWERWLRDHPDATHLPPIVPVVVHNGDRPWRSPTQLESLFHLPDVPRDAWVRSFLPSLEILLVDLAGPEFTRDRLRGAGADTVSETLLEILQAATRPEAEHLFADWTSRLESLRGEPAGGSTLVAVLWYLLSVSAVPDQQIVAASEVLPEPARDTFMTGAEQLIQRGLERGLVRGREEGEHAALAFTVVRLARQRFGEVPAETAARIEASTRAELERYIDTILTAERLADLFT